MLLSSVVLLLLGVRGMHNGVGRRGEGGRRDLSSIGGDKGGVRGNALCQRVTLPPAEGDIASGDKHVKQLSAVCGRQAVGAAPQWSVKRR